MKYLAITIFVFITTSCLAISQNLIDGNEKYKIAINNLKEIEINILTKQDSLETWLNDLNEARSKTGISHSDEMVKFYQMQANETKNQINNINLHYAKIKETIKELEPIKIEYDKQIQLEHKKAEFNNTTWRTVWYITVLLIFAFSIFLALFIYKRNQRFCQMMKDGKLSKEEYEKLMEPHKASAINFDSNTSFKTYGVRYGWWR